MYKGITNATKIGVTSINYCLSSTKKNATVVLSLSSTNVENCVTYKLEDW